MTDSRGAGVPARDPDRIWSYVGALLLEAAVVAALWVFGAYFSG